MITLLELRPYIGEADDVLSSPNHGERKAPAILGIVLHATQDAGNEAGTLSWLRYRKSGVSCHLLVSRTGHVTRLVGDHQRAWHAGRSWWRGTSDVNSITLGIEIANRNDGEAYSDAQYHRVADIVAHYCRQGLSLDDVVSHGEIAQERKTDPLGWDWDRFRTMVQEQLAPVEVIVERPFSAPPAAAPPAMPQNVEGWISLPLDVPPRTALPRNTSVRATPSRSTPPRARVIAPGKPVIRSRTIWLNGLTIIAAGSMIVDQTLDLAFRVGLTVPERVTMWALMGVGMVNIILRFQTNCPLGNCDCVDHSPQARLSRSNATTLVYDKGGTPATSR
jgi:hypothetical protein